MKKISNIDNKGFVIVETIVVAVFVVGICTFLFANFLPLIADYERVSNYDNLESKYKTHEFKKMVLREIANDSNKQTIFTNINLTSSRYFVYENNQLCNRLVAVNYCKTLLSEQFLDVREVMITTFKLSYVKQKVKTDNNISRELKEYINYLPDYNKYSSKYNNYYRMIVLFNNGNVANLEVII